MTLRLLVADDNASVHMMVRLAFEGEDAEIEAVLSGDAALDILHEFCPDAVLADVSMPGYSGYEVCELIRQDPKFADIPVILMSGALDAFDEEEAARVAVSGQLAKPFNPAEMIAMVKRLVPERSHDCRQVQVPDFTDRQTGPDSCNGRNNNNDEAANPAESGAPRDFFHVSPRAIESYVGRNRILEIFNFNGEPSADWHFSDELLDRVAEKVVEKMFPDIEAVIRKTLERTAST